MFLLFQMFSFINKIMQIRLLCKLDYLQIRLFAYQITW